MGIIRKKKVKGIKGIKPKAKEVESFRKPRNTIDADKTFKLTPREIKDLEVNSLPKKERDKILRDEKTIYNGRVKKGKHKTRGTRIKLHSDVQVHAKRKTKYKNVKVYIKKQKIKQKEAKKELNAYLEEGGSLKDKKAKQILNRLNPTKNKKNIYHEKVLQIKNTPIKTNQGDIPSLLDFGITYPEVKFITEFIKDYDEIRAATNAKLINKHMVKEEQERIINETLGNPNVAQALQCAVQDQIHRTLITSDRTLTQIAKIAFADPLELYKSDGSGTIRDIGDIPPALRCCISEITNTNTYHGRGDDRVVSGSISKIKLHDSLKALQVILKDIREKTNKVGNVNFNQYNIGNFNINDRLKDLSDEELDVLVKLSNQGVEANMVARETKEVKQIENNGNKEGSNQELNIQDSSDEIIELAREKNLKDGTQLYSLNNLKGIEQCNLDS